MLVAEGGWRRATGFIAYGSTGTISGASSAARTIAKTMTTPTDTDVLRRANRSMPPAETLPRASRTGAAGTSALTAIANPRVQVSIGQIDRQINDREQQRNNEYAAL